MTVELKQPQFLIDEVKKLGVTLRPVAKFDPKAPLLAVHAQLQGHQDADFGCCFGEFGCDECSEFGSFLRHIIGRKADRAVSKGLHSVAKIAAPVGAIASFAIPGVGPLIGGSAIAALAGADKLLGDKKISPKARAQIISNTKAMAAMGDPGAKRGALVLAAAEQIRKEKGVKPGQAAVPHPAATTAPYIRKTPRNQVRQLAVKKAASKPHDSLWQKIKKFFHVGVHANVSAKVTTAK